MEDPMVCEPPISGLQVISTECLRVRPPIIVNAVSRIRNINSGWRNTVSGVTTAATGWTSSLSGVIASAFYNSKASDSYTDTSSPKKNYYLMVFSPSGNMVQYALRLSPGVDSTSLPGTSTTCESGLDCDIRLAVEPIQKWNICQKQNRKEREDNIYGEKGNSDSSKVFPERMRNENSVRSNVEVATTKDNINDEKHHVYISEVELQMHQSRNPLCSKSEIYFQSMLTDGCNIDDESACRREIEIERIPARVLETKIPVINSSNNGQTVNQGSENGELTYRSSSSSLDSTNNVGIVVAEETGRDGLQVPETNRGFVYTNDTHIVNTELGTVNTKENSSMGSQRSV